MKRFILMFLSALLLGTLAGCAAKNTDAYYGDVKLEWVDWSYMPEVPDNDEWQTRRGKNAAAGLDLTKTKDFLEYLEKVDHLIMRYFVRSNGGVTDIIHFENGVWALRYWCGENLLCSDVAVFYRYESTGEIFHEDALCDGDVMPWERNEVYDKR